MVNSFGGDWTKNKLDILEGYLKNYTTALKKQPFKLWYVDAFAGTGYINLDSGDVTQSKLLISEEGQANEMANVLKGSTRLALEVEDKPFDEFIFIEQNPEYAIELSSLRQEFNDRNIQVIPGDANKFLQNWCQSQNKRLGTPWRGERAVIFLDPFASQVDWQTVQLISKTKSVDLWILFPLSALSRMLPKEREPDDANADHLDRVFGGSKWREKLYHVSNQQSLFGTEEKTVRDDQQAIVDLYLANLCDVFEEVSPKPKWFLNSRNSPLFVLMFAAANPGQGGHIARDIANHLLNNW